MYVLREKIFRKLAYLLPKRLVYFACIRLGVYASTGKYSNVNFSELTMIDAVRTWETDFKIL